ncbi:protein FAR-RED IMPAIRED RESPONSE 1-like [Zingiber officinale]|uniref:protein FAR-RED IMPAIRED RESPONSE 1-like n=1 Tax=Zingiber officinale TaxID=94328 RepID=UPI001C4ABBBE|nr:protein FAR-RED IMPAIRED RESPONSE 1-like [Zingiber officinale]
MEIAILEVFPDSHHCLCLWHIMKKLPAKFSSHANYKLIKRNLKNIVYNSLTTTECDSNWKKFIKEFNLEKNDWLNSLYEIRHKWMPVYVKDKFWAGMSTSQRSESMNVFFDNYVHSKTTLKQFVEQYDNALKSKIEKQDNSDFASFNSIIPVISGNPIEKQFQSVYTNKIFKLFQNELRCLMFCNTSFVKEEGSTLFFEVMETVYGKDGTTPKEISFWVQYSELQCQMKCLCRLFEFRGIVCRHLMSVLVKRKVTTVPEHYILERWCKDIKRGYQGITNIYDDSCQHAEERRRYNNLQPLLQEVGQLGSKNDESNIIHEESRNESKKFHSPLKGSTIDRKQDELSNIEQIDKFSESQRLCRLDKELLVPNDIIQTMERTRSFEKPIDLLQMHADLFKEGESAKMNFEINDYPGYGDENLLLPKYLHSELYSQFVGVTQLRVLERLNGLGGSKKMQSGHFLERKVCISIVAIVKDSSILIERTISKKESNSSNDIQKK